MSETPARPLSPHLSIWKWGPHMAVSIVNRVAGGALAVVGAMGLVWWLLALSGGQASYDKFLVWANWWPAKIILIGITWAFFQHMLSGIRHFVLDIGAGYELGANRRGTMIVFILAVVLTAALWGYLTVMKG
jgi:succinate dehydrogenase / fumarate reductase, cytochrome b subunit